MARATHLRLVASGPVATADESSNALRLAYPVPLPLDAARRLRVEARRRGATEEETAARLLSALLERLVSLPS